MFKAEENVRRIADMQEQQQSELLARINELLINGGYFRARLNIDPFDKILGGMCWSIAGSNYDIDIEFQDDLIMGQKIKLSEKVVASLKIMECPLQIFPHQIQGLDYSKIYPVLQWLIRKLMESRDTRGERNKKQGILNYNLKYSESQNQEGQEGQQKVNNENKEKDIQKMKEIVFRGKPRRVFKSNRTRDVAFHDPKRVHTALREFNDLSANKVFQAIIDQIAQFELEEKAQRQQLVKQGKLQGQDPNQPSGSYNLQEQTQEEVIANVERMLANEKLSQKNFAKASAAQEFDLNEGIVQVKQTKQNIMGNLQQQQQNLSQFETMQEQFSQQQQVQRGTTKQIVKSGEQQYQASESQVQQNEGLQAIEEQEEQVLDQDISLIRRRTIAVRADNVSDVFMQNIEQISETVNGFQKLSEESFQNDAAFYFQSEKDNYEKQIEKLKNRVQKSSVQRQELQSMVVVLQQEVDSMEYEREQYHQQVQSIQGEAEQIDQTIERSTVKEHEIMVVTALIDEKARLNEEKLQLKKNCRDEKAKLDQELEKMKKRREEMEKDEHSEILRQIDQEFDFEHSKLLEQRKQIADINRNITVLQRKIENCPSKIEITQFHKRLVELFDNLNLKYNSWLNDCQFDYLREINDTYKASKHKKEKEVLLHNIKNVLDKIDISISQSSDSLNKLKVDYQRVQAQFNESILREKDHFKRIKEFEDECDKNDAIRATMKK
ncbi:UNKNOWN [Stylonychia lemnae]|uniref:Uncharacterized protein n=1 Tax=Stylonychia lemnae TaxID=5949 RepID=A0A078B6Q3_STYLE|nr:UNKNOWN [Stylonychia lemnae]|eukprot:CDW88967.1 UNKNOWN [Stylonychia lemnae]